MASVAGSNSCIDPADHLRNYFRAYISKLEDIDKQNLGLSHWLYCRDRIPDEMSREYGDLRSALREVEVDKIWMIQMSVTGSQCFTWE